MLLILKLANTLPAGTWKDLVSNVTQKGHSNWVVQVMKTYCNLATRTTQQEHHPCQSHNTQHACMYIHTCMLSSILIFKYIPIWTSQVLDHTSTLKNCKIQPTEEARFSVTLMARRCTTCSSLGLLKIRISSKNTSTKSRPSNVLLTEEGPVCF